MMLPQVTQSKKSMENGAKDAFEYSETIGNNVRHKSPVTAEVIDASIGKPAAGVEIRLQEHRKFDGGAFAFNEIAYGYTNSMGICTDILPPPDDKENGGKPLKQGIYKIIFRTKEYFEEAGKSSFYPWVEIVFEVNGARNYHLPLTVTPFSFSTFRGNPETKSNDDLSALN